MVATRERPGTCEEEFFTMSDSATTIDTYLEAYGEADATTRRTLIERAWAPDGELVDPPMNASGHDAIDAMFAAVQDSFPGHRFRRASGVDEHHGSARYRWELVAPDGAVALSGLDVASFEDTGRLARVIGFFGDLPALER
jgi:hypothetical protein